MPSVDRRHEPVLRVAMLVQVSLPRVGILQRVRHLPMSKARLQHTLCCILLAFLGAGEGGRLKGMCWLAQSMAAAVFGIGPFGF